MKIYIPLLLLLTACHSSGPAPSDQVASQPDNQLNSNDRPADSVRPDTVGTEHPLLDRPVIITYDYDTTEGTDIQLLDPSIRLDIRYATDNNFVGAQMYECGRCFLRPEVARAVVRAHQDLQDRELALKMFDCYRPLSVQWRLWEKVSTPGYVADPRKGSVHNRGGAVDLTIVDAEGEPLEMGTPYDYFGRKAYHTYRQLPDSILHHRQLLKDLMEAYGFRSIRTEWWHYSYTRKRYPISEMEWKCPE